MLGTDGEREPRDSMISASLDNDDDDDDRRNCNTIYIAQLAGAEEYADCTSAEE